jgi:hypothetical protein
MRTLPIHPFAFTYLTLPIIAYPSLLIFCSPPPRPSPASFLPHRAQIANERANRQPTHHRLTFTSPCQLRVRRNRRRRPSRSQTSCRSTLRPPRSYWQRVVGVPRSLSTGMCIHGFLDFLSGNIQEEDNQSRRGWAVHGTRVANDRSDQTS